MARTATQVFFYVPNLIGYARVVLSVYSLAVALTDFKTSVICYALSFVCDYFDGFFARWFDQCAPCLSSRRLAHALVASTTDGRATLPGICSARLVLRCGA
jgi:hypothetical protein